jgi:hypothetical protein
VVEGCEENFKGVLGSKGENMKSKLLTRYCTDTYTDISWEEILTPDGKVIDRRVTKYKTFIVDDRHETIRFNPKYERAEVYDV